MTPRTKPMVPLNDGRYWRKLMASVHPDRDHGDEELFKFLQSLREYVEGCMDASRGVCANANHDSHFATASNRHRGADFATPDRIPYDPALGAEEEFLTLTLRALSIGQREEEPYQSLLRLLLGYAPTDHGRRADKQARGATYKQLAYVAHLAGLSTWERSEWYAIARSVPLAEAHAAYLIGELKRQLKRRAA
jgi:hypothetical protein